MLWYKLTILFMPLAACLFGNLTGFIQFGTELQHALAGAAGLALGGLLALAMYELDRLFEEVSDTFGSARFAAPLEIRAGGLYGRRGLVVGKQVGRLLRFNRPGHWLTIAPTRSGKTTCSVIPQLLEQPDRCGFQSAVVVDIKGEIAAITGRHRASAGPVWRFSPFEDDSACFNPLDFVRQGEDLWEDCALLAEMIVTPSGSGDAVFFEAEARALITGLLIYILCDVPAHKRTLTYLRRLLMTGEFGLSQHLERMTKSRNPVVRRTANSFMQKEDKLKSAVLAEAQSHTAIFDSGRVARVTATSDFTFEALKKGPGTVYLCIPPEHLDVYRPLLRLMLGIAVRGMTRDRNRPLRDVLFLVDEFPALGSMRPLQDGLAYLAGYGCKLWLFAQDLAQLESIYGPQGARSILANCCLQAFGTMDQGTAELLSKMLGNTTRRTQQQSRSRRSWMWPDYDRFNHGSGETGRPLLTADEIRCLGSERQLLFLKDMKPILCRKLPYYAHAAYKGRFDSWAADGGRQDG